MNRLPVCSRRDRGNLRQRLLLPHACSTRSSVFEATAVASYRETVYLSVAKREEAHVKVDAREEVTDAVTRGGRLLFLSSKRRSLAAFRQVFSTGKALGYRMPLLCMRLLMQAEVTLLVEVLVTDVARKVHLLLMNPLSMLPQCLRPCGRKGASDVGASDTSSLVHRLPVVCKLD